MKLFLASSSPRRAMLLTGLGLPFEVVQPAGPEPAPGNAPPNSHAQETARFKGRQFLHLVAAGDAIILAADTIVCLDGEILGKPEDARVALRMLEKLNGRIHMVYSGWYLAWSADGQIREIGGTECSKVQFARWEQQVLAAYAMCGEPLDKAGAYAVQGKGAFLISAIDGSWSNIVGLPVTALVRQMLGLGLMRICKN